MLKNYEQDVTKYTKFVTIKNLKKHLESLIFF